MHYAGVHMACSYRCRTLAAGMGIVVIRISIVFTCESTKLDTIIRVNEILTKMLITSQDV